MTETTPLIIPELVVLDATAGPGKEDVIEFLASTIASAGRASSPDGLAADAKAREATAPTGISEGIAIPHCRSPHVLAPSLGFARLTEGVDFGAADGKAADLVFMIAAPDGADDFHLQLLAKLARGLMQSEFTGALREAATPEDVVRVVTRQVQPELLEDAEDSAKDSAEDEAADGEEPAGSAKAAESSKTSASAGGSGGASSGEPGGEAAGGAGTGSAQASGTVIVGVSSCPTGIAHTFMAAEALEQVGKDRGITVAIEGQGSGKIDALDPALIERADAVIFAHDLPVKGRERFAGKPVVDVGVKAAVNDAASLVDQALAAIDDPAAARVPSGGGEEAAQTSEEGSEHWARRLQRAVMTGVSYMIPFVAAGGLLTALGFLFGGYDITDTAENIVTGSSLWNLPDLGTADFAAPNALGGSPLMAYIGAVLVTLGGAAMDFLVPALAGYVAFGLAGRPGIAPGFAMGAVAVAVGSGFIGGLVGGILAGYVAAWLAGLDVPSWLRGLMPVVVIPLGTTLTVGALMYMLLGRPLAALMEGLQSGLGSMSEGGSAGAILLGVVLGLMMCFDLGGPVNKAAYLFATAGLSEGTTASYEIMAAVMAAGMVPPLAVSAATFLRKQLFTKAEVENGRSAWLLGLSFISEGAIPFAAADPLRIIPATMAGGAVTGALTMALHVGSRAPHGGIFVAFAITNFLGFILAILAGAAVTTALVIALKGLGRQEKAANAEVAAAAA